MKLYHGTAAARLPDILKHGLKPRGGKGKGNWKDTVPSNPKTVYLTTAYAVYYALCAAKDGGDLAVFEVDTDLLPPCFVPDEDAIEQALRGHDNVAGNTKARTIHYRKLLAFNKGNVDHGPVAGSLKVLGNCGYMGAIPPMCITRYAIIKLAEVDPALVWRAMDPTITVMNYRICGGGYRDMVRWVFGEPLEEADGILPFDPPASRAGVTVHSMEEVNALQGASAG